MKSTIVRLSVLALSLTGFAASTFAAKSAPKKDKFSPVVLGTICTPMCDPRKSSCGI